MGRSLTVHLRTLTPLWTGGVDGTADRIHETGLIGGLRWWYEALVRSLGGEACDPTSNPNCYDPTKPEFPAEQLCPACWVFGTTGWRRRFRLTVDDHTYEDTESPTKLVAERPRSPKWFFPGHPRSGDFSVEFQSLFPSFPVEVIAGLFQFVADWAAIGAKTQMGFGVVEPVEERLSTRPLYEWLQANVVGKQRQTSLPSLSETFFARMRVPTAKEEATFNIKHDIRSKFSKDKRVRHFIMGKSFKKHNIGSKIHISRPYHDGLIRAWGWIPEQADEYQRNWDRESVTSYIYSAMSNSNDIELWREMNSPRDTEHKDLSDVDGFIRSLLRIDSR